MMLRQQALMMQEVSKLQEERMKRQMHGLPDFTPEEINERMSKLEQKAPGLFSSLFSNN
jgi:hypothetical protein